MEKRGEEIFPSPKIPIQVQIFTRGTDQGPAKEKKKLKATFFKRWGNKPINSTEGANGNLQQEQVRHYLSHINWLSGTNGRNVRFHLKRRQIGVLTLGGNRRKKR